MTRYLGLESKSPWRISLALATWSWHW